MLHWNHQRWNREGTEDDTLPGKASSLPACSTSALGPSFQKDHLIISLYDILSRYTPKVEPNQIQIEFVPVLSRADEDIPKEALDYEKV